MIINKKKITKKSKSFSILWIIDYKLFYLICKLIYPKKWCQGYHESCRPHQYNQNLVMWFWCLKLSKLGFEKKHASTGGPKKYSNNLTLILNLWSVFFGTPCTLWGLLELMWITAKALSNVIRVKLQIWINPETVEKNP